MGGEAENKTKKERKWLEGGEGVIRADNMGMGLLWCKAHRNLFGKCKSFC